MDILKYDTNLTRQKLLFYPLPVGRPQQKQFCNHTPKTRENQSFAALTVSDSLHFTEIKYIIKLPVNITSLKSKPTIMVGNTISLVAEVLTLCCCAHSNHAFGGDVDCSGSGKRRLISRRNRGRCS